MVLDAQWYPHIVDAILSAAIPFLCEETLLELRQFSKRTRALVDDYALSHVVIQTADGLPMRCIAHGFLPLPTQYVYPPHLSPTRTRVVDIDADERHWDPRLDPILAALAPDVLRILDSREEGFVDYAEAKLRSAHTLVTFQRNRTISRHPLDAYNRLAVRKVVINLNSNKYTWLQLNWSAPDTQSWVNGVQEVVLVFPAREFARYPTALGTLDSYNDGVLLQPFLHCLVGNERITHILVGLDQVHPRWLDPDWRRPVHSREAADGGGEAEAEDVDEDDGTEGGTDSAGGDDSNNSNDDANDSEDRDNDDSDGDDISDDSDSDSHPRTSKISMTLQLARRNLELAATSIEEFREHLEDGDRTGPVELLTMDKYRARVGDEVFAYETVI